MSRDQNWKDVRGKSNDLHVEITEETFPSNNTQKDDEDLKHGYELSYSFSDGRSICNDSDHTI